MSKLKLLQEEMETNVKRQQALIDIRNGKAAGIEKRELNEDELAEFELLDTEIEKLEKSILLERKIETSSKRNAEMRFMDVAKEATPEQKVQRDYSLLRAIGLKANGKQLDGLELEMHQEAAKEAFIYQGLSL